MDWLKLNKRIKFYYKQPSENLSGYLETGFNVEVLKSGVWCTHWNWLAGVFMVIGIKCVGTKNGAWLFQVRSLKERIEMKITSDKLIKEWIG